MDMNFRTFTTGAALIFLVACAPTSKNPPAEIKTPETVALDWILNNDGPVPQDHRQVFLANIENFRSTGELTPMAKMAFAIAVASARSADIALLRHAARQAIGSRKWTPPAVPIALALSARLQQRWEKANVDQRFHVLLASTIVAIPIKVDPDQLTGLLTSTYTQGEASAAGPEGFAAIIANLPVSRALRNARWAARLAFAEAKEWNIDPDSAREIVMNAFSVAQDRGRLSPRAVSTLAKGFFTTAQFSRQRELDGSRRYLSELDALVEAFTDRKVFVDLFPPTSEERVAFSRANTAFQRTFLLHRNAFGATETGGALSNNHR